MISSDICCKTCIGVAAGASGPGAANYRCPGCGERDVERLLDYYRRFGGPKVAEQIKNRLVEKWVKEA